MSNQEATCPKYGYHDYHRTIDNGEAIVETCHKCGKKMIYNKRDGRTDQQKYARANYRQVLQPGGKMLPDFIREYGSPFNA